MADRKTVARSAIQRLNQLFEDAPEVDQEEVSRLEAVRLLARNIQRMTAKGYSAPTIVKMMVENGVPITAPTLKNLPGASQDDGPCKETNRYAHDDRQRRKKQNSTDDAVVRNGP
jgi:hypothetical protein